MSPHEQLELLSAYVDGELDDAEVRDLEAHLPGCSDCRGMLDALRATVADLALLGEPEMDPQVSWALRAQIARARRRPGRIGQAAMAMSGVAAVVIAFVAFAGGDSARDLSAGGATLASTAAIDGVVVEGTDYDAASATTLVRPEGDDLTGASAQEKLRTEASDPHEATVAPLAFEVDWDAVFADCEPRIAQDMESPYALLSARGASFEGEPALLLIYEVGQGEGARRELWVLSTECDVVFFAQE